MLEDVVRAVDQAEAVMVGYAVARDHEGYLANGAVGGAKAQYIGKEFLRAFPVQREHQHVTNARGRRVAIRFLPKVQVPAFGEDAVVAARHHY